MRRLTVLAFLVALLVLPQAATASPLNFITIQPSMANGGASVTGTLSLSFRDPAPTTVLLFSSAPAAAQVPATVVIPANTLEKTFTITTSATVPETPVQITAWVDNVPRSANMTVNQPTPGGAQLSAVSVTPSSIVAGQQATGKITFTAPTAEGANVQVTSSRPQVAQVPSEVVVNKGAATSTFVVKTFKVSSPISVTITAKWFTITKTTTITVSPGQAPAADVVRITRAEWKQGLLRIEATSTNFNAVLGVYSRAGNFMFNLTNNGGGRYSDQRGFIDNPQFITVKSNFGGSASATLTT